MRRQEIVKIIPKDIACLLLHALLLLIFRLRLSKYYSYQYYISDADLLQNKHHVSMNVT